MERVKKTRDKRKLLLVLPFLLLPFLALGFYALGGGRQVADEALIKGAGLNAALPDANFRVEEPVDKMGFYDRAKKDTAKGSELSFTAQRMGFGGDGVSAAARQAEQLDLKLAALQREIAEPESATPSKVKRELRGAGSGRTEGGQMKGEVDRLELMMKSMADGKQRDPEMEQLQGLMQGILDIQHPERVMARGQLDASLYVDSMFRAIPAVVEGNQKVAQGGVVKLRLTDTVRLGSVMLPAGQLLFGSCNITNQRLLLTIRHVRLGTSIVPVDLSVFSLDGLPGINAPDAELYRAAGDGTVGAMGGMRVLDMDGSIGMQAASAGIDAARGLIGKKVKKIRVKLKGGMKVLLRENKMKR